MTELLWSSDYNTNIRAIDGDHKALFEIFNLLQNYKLKSKSHEQIFNVIVQLTNYVNYHFDREEGFMEKAGYPDTVEHKRLHKVIRDQLQGLLFLHQASPEEVNITKVVDFLYMWLRGHILGSDMEYAPYVRGEKQGVQQEGNKTYQQPHLVKLSVNVPSDQAGLIGNFIDVVVEHGMTDNLQQLMQDVYDKKLSVARKLFT